MKLKGQYFNHRDLRSNSFAAQQGAMSGTFLSYKK